MHEELLQKMARARDAAYGTLGRMEADVLTFILNPTFNGGPRWPSLRQAWRVIHRPGGMLLASDGLSDPFDDQDGPSMGFGIECILETDEPLPRVQDSWPFQALVQVCQTAAGHGGLRQLLDEMKLVSVELSGEGMPDSLVTADDSVGVLLGMGSSTLPTLIQTPAGDVHLVTVKLLLAEELEYVRQNGAKGRAELARRFARNGEEHLSRARRAPVI
ncbi:suppressor of fused domain protein [Hyalangium rubrum]|uniref:Suppressor of fused domain protein n=1 Tax=Hyalangium rubrum TaxID=3103134 RepID=A0ABU5HCT6_9BACT|nr:suppressor of fused domain protein [Hyalangium sp. s54d21]MDY7231278.1 suppressor of fused domain protein [Hyalangium sp. s54d21]